MLWHNDGVSNAILSDKALEFFNSKSCSIVTSDVEDLSVRTRPLRTAHVAQSGPVFWRCSLSLNQQSAGMWDFFPHRKHKTFLCGLLSIVCTLHSWAICCRSSTASLAAVSIDMAIGTSALALSLFSLFSLSTSLFCMFLLCSPHTNLSCGESDQFSQNFLNLLSRKLCN